MKNSSSEDICRKCGRCCYAKMILDGEVVFTPYPCPYLDEHTRLCTVYGKRHEINPDCLTLKEGIKIGVFPADCPYVADLKDYVPPREEWTQEDLEIYNEYFGDEEEAEG